jgi:phosphodiesterase/alkaline phosphatase D-like protein
MLRRPSMTSDECRRRAEEAQTLAAQTQHDWERELLQRITTQWVVLAVHKKGMEGERTSRTEQ